ncbi:MAG: 50S ribosomal protein L11 methyltransferase [Chitinophagales bacterium]
MSYLSFTFDIKESWQQELVIAALDAIGFEGFEQQEEKLIGFIQEISFNQDEFQTTIKPLQQGYGFSFSQSPIADQNWNKVWEKSFQPIIIGNDITVRASFHPPFAQVKYDIVIDPKMSFGTGHHATTSMMMQLMLAEDLENKRVLDFGSGTGILSILAAKLNASAILSIDHEQWAYKNSIENFQLNNVFTATALMGDTDCFEGQTFDVILANINRSVIISSMQEFALSLKNKGSLLISGFLEADENVIVSVANTAGFGIIHKLRQDGWIALSLRSNQN